MYLTDVPETRGFFKPKCKDVNEKYTFENKQCLDAMCWCVDSSGSPQNGTLTKGNIECDENGMDLSSILTYAKVSCILKLMSSSLFSAHLHTSTILLPGNIVWSDAPQAGESKLQFQILNFNLNPCLILRK